MPISMTRVAAITMRATSAVLPGYGDNSFLRSSPNQDREEGVAEALCAAVAMLNSRESSQPQIRQLEKVLEWDSPPAREPDNGMPSAPS
jgi:hypothetical protein